MTVLKETVPEGHWGINPGSLAFHPKSETILATLGMEDTIIRIWDLDLTTLLGIPSTPRPVVSANTPLVRQRPKPIAPLPAPPSTSSPGGKPPQQKTESRPERPVRPFSPPIQPGAPALAKVQPQAPVKSTTPSSVRYTNARVLLVGDSGVGKSGLGLVLTGQPFAPTESTHGRYVWTFESQEIELGGERKETRETLLWDLAGQPGYRLVHQLHLNEVTVALVIFDGHSETDPFAGVYHWDRALRLAQRVQGSAALPMKKFLVAARVDRGGTGVSAERIRLVVQELGFDGFFATSAKEGRNIAALIQAIQGAIDWTQLPWVQSSELFQRIKTFLVEEKEAGRVLSTAADLYHAFLRAEPALARSEELRKQFETCIGLVESRGLIRRLSFGNLVLLQPELLDTYASALVNAVRDDPDGFGSITERKAKAGDFAVPADQKLKDKEQEKLLLIAMIEDMLRNEIALREEAEDGTYLIFPSQSTRENPNLPDPEGKAVVFSFEGPVQNVYATLAVRLSHSGMFQKKDFWKNAITYTTRLGGSYGIFLHNSGEGLGELTLFFDKVAREDICFHFEEYIAVHLQ